MTRPVFEREWMHEIAPDVWCGRWEAADWIVATQQPRWAIVCVLEQPRDEDRRPETICQPALVYRKGAGGPGAPENWVATRESLDAIADTIDEQLERGNRVLVHCGIGAERSPMAVAWWLARGRGVDLDRAYQWIGAMRPGVIDRRSWMAPECLTP